LGSKKEPSMNMCTMILKEAVAYYTSNRSLVFCVFLDATKSCDRVCHTKLYVKLIERKLPYVVRHWMNLHNFQYSRVCWNSIFSRFIFLV
jgi:hypothetical protein